MHRHEDSKVQALDHVHIAREVHRYDSGIVIFSPADQGLSGILSLKLTEDIISQDRNLKDSPLFCLKV